MHTIWGPSQHCKTVADGIQQVSTASHGGYKLDAIRNALVPAYMRQAGGWYEEDCDWAIVAVIFPAAFAHSWEGGPTHTETMHRPS